MGFGPGLALRGPERGMEEATQGLEIEKNVTFWYFRAGIAFFGISSCFYIWIFFVEQIAIIVTVLLIIFLVMFFIYNHSIQKRFEIPEGFNAYSTNPMANMKDLMSKKIQPGTLTHLNKAFSLDQNEKVNAQERIEQDSELLYDYLENKCGSFYLCGPSDGMSTQMRAAVVDV